MKKIVVILVLLISNLGWSQVSKDLGEFNSVSVFDRISVQLIPSNENRIEISGTRADEVELINKNGTLKIRMILKKLRD